jgi:hypothetical protein
MGFMGAGAFRAHPDARIKRNASPYIFFMMDTLLSLIISEIYISNSF